MSSYDSISEQMLDPVAIINDTSYDAMSNEQKFKLISKVDNFLEALYLAPHLFGRYAIQLLKYREEKLSMWRHNAQAICGFSYLSIYLYRKLYKNAGSGFYFRNFGWMSFFAFLSAYAGGRAAEYIGNKYYYEKILFKLASIYNVTDDEIEELQFKMNEEILKENKEEQSLANSLDKVKFRV